MRKEVLDHGFIELVDYMGSDERILESARMSTGGVGKTTDKKDRGLIRYLYRNQHLTPFEMCTFTFHVKLPIFVARQWMRHRNSYNEYSGRYSEMPQEFYTPEHFYKQSESNHQGSGEELEKTDSLIHTYTSPIASSYAAYSYMLEEVGVSKEQARMVLPLTQYTEFYWTLNLRNLFHFLELRLHPHAQYEIRVYAEAILEILENIDDLMWSVEIFKDMNELDIIYQDLLNTYKLDLNSLKEKLKDFFKS